MIVTEAGQRAPRESRMWLNGRPLTNVFVFQFMGEADSLRLMLHRLAVNNSNPEMLDYRFMNCVTLERLVSILP